MATTRELKGRINSVHSSQKITGAMKMISSARLRKAENALYNTCPYLEQLQRLLDRIAGTCDYISPWSIERSVEKVAVVVFGSDEGLCGSFNLMLYKKLQEELLDREKGKKVEVYPVGKKILTEVKRTAGIEIKEIPELTVQKEHSNVMLSLADELMYRFLKKEVDRVDIIYAHYKSIGSQEMTCFQLLPWKGKELEKLSVTEQNRIYIYEPDCVSILDTVYPLTIRSALYRAFLENQTSEQAARILSMQMANDNAIKLLGNLQLEYNKLRQQGITTELLDIAGGVVE